MRIYIPLLPKDLLSSEISPRVVHAATPTLERELGSSDREENELVATLYAADSSLALWAAELGVERGDGDGLGDGLGDGEVRRIVAAAQVPDEWVRVVDGVGDSAALGDWAFTSEVSSALALAKPLPWAKAVSIHVDIDENVPVLLAALAGDDAAFERSGEAELLWYDVTEREAVAALFTK